MKKLLTLAPCLLLASAVSFVSQANEPSYSAMAKDLAIMNNIFKSALVTEDPRKGYAVGKIESTYLLGQGAVFTVYSSSGLRRLFTEDFIVVAPEPPQPPEPIDVEFHTIAGDSYERAMEVYEQAMEGLVHSREGLRDLKEQQRDFSYEIRDINRELRDLSFREKRTQLDKADKNELKAELKEKEARKEKLEKALADAAKKVRKATEKQKQVKELQEQTRQKYFSQLAQQVTDTLCSYGSGLKVLPSKERISIILKAAGSTSKRGFKDNILVFKKKDILDCTSDKISADKLLSKSKSYQF